MRMYDLIMKKRNGKLLEKEEIDWMISEYTVGRIPDYQMSAFLMAVYFQGMSKEETLNLTMAMAHSGEMLDLSGIRTDRGLRAALRTAIEEEGRSWQKKM